MKEDELRKHAVCSNCNGKIGYTGIPLFWTITVDRYGLKVDAIKRQDGLAAMLGGHAGLARAMGINEEMTEKVMETKVITLCENCAMKKI